MLVATWNLNNRVGRVRFRPEAAAAAAALGADVLVLTEFFPQLQEQHFRAALATAGWPNQLMSAQTAAVANRILIASKLPLVPLPLDLPAFDQQFPANIAAVALPTAGLSVVGVRVPFYSSKEAPLLVSAWNWLEQCAAALRNTPSLIAGDLNASVTSGATRGGHHFRRILSSGWHHANPAEGATYYGRTGQTTEIDHILATEACVLAEPTCIRSTGGFTYCGSQDAISDHAALRCQVKVDNHRAKDA